MVVLKDGRKISFAEISKLPQEQQDNIIGEMSDKQIEEFTNYFDTLGKAANQRNEEKKWVEQAANQRIDGKKEQLINLNTALKSSTNTLRSLSSLPPGIEQKALAEATKNPPKELAGVPPEQYGEYKNLILADYTISHANEIHRSLSTEDREVFDKSLTDITDKLWRRPPNWPEIVETRGGLVLGERREEIKNLGEQYIRDGYNQSVVWDSQSRSLIFRGRDGEKIIDTAPVPPQERIEQAGLSISREAAPIILSPTEASHQKLDRDIISDIDTMGQSQTTRGRIDPVAQSSIDESFRMARAFPDTKDKLAYTYAALWQKKKALEQSKQDTLARSELAESNALTSDIEQTERQIKQIEELAKSYEKSLGYLREEKWANQSDTFDSIARANLDWLTSEDTLFQRMWPSGNKALYRIITDINKGRQDNPINLSENKLDISEKKLLKEKYEKLWGTLSNLKSAESIRAFQIKISTATEKKPDESGSIERILHDEEKKY